VGGARGRWLNDNHRAPRNKRAKEAMADEQLHEDGSGLRFLQKPAEERRGGDSGHRPVWVAPTARRSAELEKRINDLRTIQFWLEAERAHAGNDDPGA
jgi:hypothetical protein